MTPALPEPLVAAARTLRSTPLATLFERDRDRARGLTLELVGLDGHVPFSGHPQAGRRKFVPSGRDNGDVHAEAHAH